MAEPTHGELLSRLTGQITEVRGDIKHLAETVSALQLTATELRADNNEWKALKAGAGIARWAVVTLIAALAMIGGLFKALSSNG